MVTVTKLIVILFGGRMGASILDLPGYETIDSKETETECHIRIKPKAGTLTVACPNCGVIDEANHIGDSDIGFRDLPIHIKPTSAWLVREQFRCKACGSKFRPKLEGVGFSETYRMTQRLEDVIAKLCFNSSHQMLARTCGLDEKTIRKIFFDELARRKATYRPRAPHVLGFDELKLGGEFRCVLTNIEQSTLVDLLPQRLKANVVEWLTNLEHKEDIEFATMDMYGNYKDAVRQVLPDVTCVVDKFHVVAMANQCFENIRRSMKGKMDLKQFKKLKSTRKILLMHWDDLQKQPDLFLDVSTWLNNHPALEAAYKYKEQFYDIWKGEPDYDEAKDRLNAWRSSTPKGQAKKWSPLKTATTNWEEEILNYFKNKKKLTNAKTESMNRLIRDINRDGRGYDFDALRGLILFRNRHMTRDYLKESPFRPPKGTAKAAASMQKITGSSNIMNLVGIIGDTVVSEDEWETVDFGVPIDENLANVLDILDDWPKISDRLAV